MVIQMNEIKKTFEVELETVTPVHIGSGEEYINGIEIVIRFYFYSSPFFYFFVPQFPHNNILSMAKVLTSKEENYSQWYNDLVIKAGLAENSAVRGCMVIKPYGYAIWEKMQAQLDKMFKETGHENA